MSLSDLRTLGRTGVRISPLVLGAMNFGARGNTSHDEAIALIHRALDAGINTIDTADTYSRGESETIVGRALAGRRDRVILASKFHNAVDDDPSHRGNSRRWIVRAVEDSLRRLGTDHLDLYQVHRPESVTAVDETVGALDDLVRAGKIRYYGTSVFSPAELIEVQWAADRRRLRRSVSEQVPYSLLVRGIERETLPIARKYGLGVLTYGPLAAGWLSGDYRLGGAQPASRRAELIPGRFDIGAPANAGKLAAADALARLAEEAGLSLIELAVGFVAAHPDVSGIIIGPRTGEHLDAYLRAAEVELTPEILDRIDEIVPPGTYFHERDTGKIPGALADPALRRTPVAAGRAG
ncbi:aldo/keto reductase [Nocardia sp. alder85J]|uniref:aldo/keto reductase n=1 Tax=Nocardia sp. alder85J TaxID=2862949 RepID=UPI001CD23D1C|nr:aldo/keto reductase [Nocardia sp. alder85J]MCX4099205.1 aldo/keto reductase [Nocardia sp. alder85J]